MIAASAYSAPAAPSMGEAFAAWRQNLDHSRGGRAPSIISLSDEDDGDGRCPAAKRAKVAVGNDSRSGTTTMSTAAGEARRRQNRESARKSRLRKKARERELRGDVAFYTRSNQTLAKQNAELQLMLDEARAKVNSAGGSVCKTNQANCVPQIQVAPASPVISHVPTPARLGAVKDTKTELCAQQPTSKKRMVISPITSPTEEVSETNDQGFDYIDILLESDDWLLEDDGNASGCVTGASSVASSNEIPIIDRRARTISPVIAPASLADKVISNLIPSNRAVVRTETQRSTASNGVREKKLTRREKGHIYARNARLRKKAEHERLRASAEYYARSNEELRERNKELQMMLLRARNKVAEKTDGFRHYSSVFGSKSGRACAGADKAADGEIPSAGGGQCCGQSGIGDVVQNLQSNSERDQHRRRSSVSDVDLDVEDIDIGADPDVEEWMSYLLE